MGGRHLTYVADAQIAGKSADWWGPQLRARWDATHASAARRVGAAICAWAAEESSRVLRKKLSREAKLHYGLLSASKERELVARATFKVFRPVKGGSPSQSIFDACRAHTWEMVDGKKNAMGRLVA